MTRLSGPVLLLALLTCAPPPASGQAPVARPMTPTDTLAPRYITEVAASPDGSAILIVVSRSNLATNRNESTVLLVKAGATAAVPLNLPLNGINSLRWAGDGKRVAFFATQGSPAKGGLYLIDVTALPASKYGLTEICAYDRSNSFISKAGSSLAWSPGGAMLAFAGTTEPPPTPGDPFVATRLQYKTRTSFSDNRRTHIFVVATVEHSTPKQITTGNVDDHSLDWGSEGDELIFLSNRAPDPDAALNYDIYAINVMSGAERRITNTPGVEMDPAISPDGKAIAYVATTRDVTTIDSVAEDAHLFVVPFAGGQPRELNHALDRRSSSPTWSADGSSVLFTASDHGKSLIYRVPAAGGASVPLFDRKAQVSGLAAARDGTVIFTMTEPLRPRELFRLAPGSKTPTALTLLNADLVAGWKMVEPETVAFKSFDGTDVEGWFYPALAAGATRTPLVLTIHGGPHGSFGYGFNPAVQLNAARGYATLAINPRGSSGYGQAFADGCVNNWGGADYKDLMAGVDYVLKTRPSLDPERLGVTGGSYGGFMTNWVITQTGRFKAAVSIASLSNLVSFYATSLYQDLVHAEFGGFPWAADNFETLWKWSPLAHVKDASTPTLFIHGEADNDVHITQAEEMYTALRRRGVEAALARYPREGHGFREPKHRLDAATRALAWMDRFLKASPLKGD